MSGYKLKKGALNSTPMSEQEIWELINYFFSSQSKKSTTYKFALLRAILDQTFSLTPPNYEISFETIFEKFSEIYWNLSVKQSIKQCTSIKDAVVVSVLNNYVTANTATRTLPFIKLPNYDKSKLVRKISLKAKNNVFGAVYADFSGKLFGFDKKLGKINIHPDIVIFLKSYKVNLNRLNNYEWIKWMESNSKKRTHSNYVEALENSIERKGLKVQMNTLKKEKYLKFQCFYCSNTPNTLDHVIPWSFIGHDKIWNLVYCCSKCNGKKNARLCNQKMFNVLLKRNRDLKNNNFDFNDEFKYYSESNFKDLYDYALINGLRIW